MRLFRWIPTLLLALVTTACSEMPTSPETDGDLVPADGAVVIRFPFGNPAFPSPCTGETVNVTGEGKVVFQAFTNDTGTHLSGHISIKATAVGNTTGTVYQQKFNSNFTTQAADNGATVLFSDVLRFRSISRGAADNQIDMAHLVVVLNANGTITAEIDQPRETTCVG